MPPTRQRVTWRVGVVIDAKEHTEPARTRAVFNCNRRQPGSFQELLADRGRWPTPAIPPIIDSHAQPGAATEFVVVETDASHCDYDAALRSLLAEHEQAFGQRLPFPRTHKLAGAVLQRDYRRLHVKAGPDRSWHFTMQVPNQAEIDLPRDASTDPEQPAQVASIRLAPPHTRIDILRVPQRDLDNVADWLDEWLEITGMTPFSSRPRRSGTDLMGDVLATGYHSDSILVARYMSVRANDNTFVLVLRTPLDTYRAVANDFVLAAATLQPPCG